jgi:hypothetical protein
MDVLLIWLLKRTQQHPLQSIWHATMMMAVNYTVMHAQMKLANSCQKIKVQEAIFLYKVFDFRNHILLEKNIVLLPEVAQKTT